MNCSRFEALLTAYMERTLDEPLRKAMGEHLKACAGCSRLLLQVQKLPAELARLPVLQPPAGLVESILELTVGRRPVRSFWADLILPTVRPFLTQRFAFATAMMFVFFSLMVNALGPDFSGLSYSDLRPSRLLEETDRVSDLIYKKWREINEVKNRWMAELKLLKEDLYGRLDYHLITILFKSYGESLQEQSQEKAEQEKAK